MDGKDAFALTSIVLYSTGHWIGATVVLTLLLFSLIMGD